MKRHPPPPEGAPLKPTVTKTPREALGCGAGLQGWRGGCRPDGAGPRSWVGESGCQTVAHLEICHPASSLTAALTRVSLYLG